MPAAFPHPEHPGSPDAGLGAGPAQCQILREVAGLSEDEMQQLLDAGIIANRPPDPPGSAATPSRSAGRERGPGLIPSITNWCAITWPSAAAPGSDD